MMQPPRHRAETAPRSMSQPYSPRAASISWKPCVYETIFDAYSACSTRSAKAWASDSLSGRAVGPASPREASRSAAWPTERAGEDGLRDAGHRHAQVESDLHRPAAGALLLGLVDHHVHERLARLRVHVRQHLGRDLDQVGVEAALVPGAEDLRDLGGGVPGDVAQQLVRLADELHVRVLDAVVHHLHEVPGTVRTDVGDARRTVGRLRRDLLQHRAQRVVRLLRAARHDARPVAARPPRRRRHPCRRSGCPARAARAPGAGCPRSARCRRR